MKDSRKNLLQKIYDHDRMEGIPLKIHADGRDTGSSPSILRTDVDYLESNGYVTEPIRSIGSYILILTDKGEQFVENGFKAPSEPPASNIFNIENATNSVIGTQAHVTLNIGSAIHETREKIDSSNSEDKAELHQIIDLLEMVVSNQMPVKKGLFSKFTAAIQRNSWIASPLTSILLKWLTAL